MLRASHVRSVLALTAFCLIFLAGCSGKKPVTVKGNVVLPANLKLEKEDTVSVTFDPFTKGDLPGSAQASPTDGAFSVQVAPGKYKVAVRITPYAGTPNSQKRLEQLKPYNEKYNASNTKLEYEVAAGAEQSITIDLDKGTVSKK